MNKIEKLKNKIQNLSVTELSELRNWFFEYDADIWDKEIEEDIKAGRLDLMAEKAILLYKINKFKEL